VIARLARVGGVALDARVVARTDDPRELVRAAGWIAGNALAAQGVRVVPDGAPTGAPRVFGYRVLDLAGLLAALAVVPALIDAETLPVRWRAALAALGVPTLDRSIGDAVTHGASVAVLVPPRRQRSGPTSSLVNVTADALGYRVSV
jgi:hypothetical protein